MTYRTKILLGFVGLALITNGVLLALMYVQARQSLVGQMQSTVLSIANTTAALIDIDRYQQIRERADEDSAAYQDLERYLRRARDANRRQDVRVQYIYTIAPNTENPKAAHFVVDAEEEGENKSRFGEAYKADDAAGLDFDAAQASRRFVHDQWGTWLTALVPIRDRSGKSIGLLGADVDAPGRGGTVAAAAGERAWRPCCSRLCLAVGLAVVESRRVTRPLTVVCDAVRAVGQGKLDTRVDIEGSDEFAELAAAINEMVVGLRQREDLRSTLVRYVSREVADDILASGKMAEIKGERRKITVLFADVRGFTSLSENMSPEEVVSFLNEYFDKMIDAIFRYKGTLNKFLGDGLMAMFGAPADDPYQEEHAIRAALEMQQSVQDLRREVPASPRRGVPHRHRHQHRGGGGGQYRVHPADGVHGHWGHRQHRLAPRDQDQGTDGGYSRQRLHARCRAQPLPVQEGHVAPGQGEGRPDPGLLGGGDG